MVVLGCCWGSAVELVVVAVEEVWDGGDERERERPGSRVREWNDGERISEEENPPYSGTKVPLKKKQIPYFIRIFF